MILGTLYLDLFGFMLYCLQDNCLSTSLIFLMLLIPVSNDVTRILSCLRRASVLTTENNSTIKLNPVLLLYGFRSLITNNPSDKNFGMCSNHNDSISSRDRRVMSMSSSKGIWVCQSRNSRN